MSIMGIRIIPDQKVSHDDWRAGEMYDYNDMIAKAIPAIGIPAKPNRLLIVDVDTGDGHAHDGTFFWEEFASENSMPETYTVRTPSGGFHFYYKLPEELNVDKFKPRKTLGKGVDLVYNGYVQAPPTSGYQVINGHITTITEAPVSLLAASVRGLSIVGEEDDDPFKGVHRPLTDIDITKLRSMLEWMSVNGELTYNEWFSGLISLRSGITDDETLKDLAVKWTMNNSYQNGDEYKALDIVENATPNGGIGPGTIFGIIKDQMLLKNEAATPTEMLTQRDVIEASGVHIKIDPKTGMVTVTPNETNIMHIIEAIPEFSESKMYFDTRMDSFILNNEQVDEQVISNRITNILQSSVDGLGFTNFSRRHVESAIKLLLDKRRKDPHLEYLMSLKWDGVKRIDTFFHYYVGAVDNPYTRAVGRNLWISLAARGLRPGCKMDNIVILEGAEGVKKSTLVEAIGGRYYLSLSTDEKLNNIETLRKMHQSVVVEIPELVSLISKNADATKAILTTKVDRIRNLFAQKAFDRARGFIMIGTTNDTEYLTPEMGQRRYWPIKVPSKVTAIRIEEVLVDRDQLFAEAVHRFKKNESYWDMPKTGWDKEVYKRRALDPLGGAILEYMMNCYNQDIQTTIEEVYQHLKFRDLMTTGLDSGKEKRIRNTLNHLGCKAVVKAGTDGIRRTMYSMPSDAVADSFI